MNDETLPLDPNAPQDPTAAPEAATTVMIPPHTAAAAHGVLTTLESDLEKEYAKGQSHFLTWMKMKIAELKLHLKV